MVVKLTRDEWGLFHLYLLDLFSYINKVFGTNPEFTVIEPEKAFTEVYRTIDCTESQFINYLLRRMTYPDMLHLVMLMYYLYAGIVLPDISAMTKATEQIIVKYLEQYKMGFTVEMLREIKYSVGTTQEQYDQLIQLLRDLAESAQQDDAIRDLLDELA